MEKKKRLHICQILFRRFVASAIFLVMLLPMIMTSLATDTYAAEKPSKIRDISIVFDNSCSMYMCGETAWCRAIYAMEVFASMLNEGDTLRIYPMWSIETGGTSYDRDTPLTIIGGSSDPSVIRDINTPDPEGTPIEVIDSGFQGLQNSTADEQWLIILTDGTEFSKNGVDMTSDETVTEMSSLLTKYNDTVNVMYLGIGAEAVLPSISGSLTSEVEKAADSGDVLAKLTTMGNNIFGRDALPDVKESGEISFDVSMSKLILFVQGDNISGVSLKNQDGLDCHATSIFTPSYGTRGAGQGQYSNYYASMGYLPMDTADSALSGTIVTYEELDAGDYTLSYTGNVSNVSVYYEPDVRVSVSLANADGQVLSSDTALYPGKYYLNYALVDNNGNPTNSTLLGNVKYEFDCTVNGSVQHISAQASGSTALELAGGDSLSVEGDVEYLSGYTVHVSNDDVAGMRDSFIVARDDLYVTLSEGKDSYNLSTFEQEAQYTVTLADADGPIVGDALGRVELTLDVPGLDYVCTKTADGYDIALRYQNGSAEQTACQTYTIRANASYISEEGLELTQASEPQSFQIEDDTYGLQLEMDVQQWEYILSKLDDAKPILLTLSEDGAPLDDEALQNVSLQFVVTDKKGNVENWSDAFDTEIVPGQSQYQVQLKKGEYVETGKYTISCTARTENNIAQEISATDDGKVTIRRIPMWIPILIVILLLLLLAFLIWKFFDMQVLPKDIRDSDGIFTLDGDKTPGHVSLNYQKQSAKQGTIDITTSNHPMHRGVNGSIALSVVAASPRRVKSAKRKIKVVEVTGSKRVTKVKLGGTTLVPDESGRFVPSTQKNAKSLSITMQHNSSCDITVSGVDAMGATVSGPAKLKFTFK